MKKQMIYTLCVSLLCSISFYAHAGLFNAIGNAFEGAGRAAGNIVEGTGEFVGDVLDPHYHHHHRYYDVETKTYYPVYYVPKREHYYIVKHGKQVPVARHTIVTVEQTH